ncbi:MAG: small subunit ribosomal protein [Patescibacteria group bacterium]|nr:small subunit ribosomal protein [Patescibacteria group bacterium]
MSKTDKTVYEIGYNLISTISEEEVSKQVGALKDKITSLGGEIISEENPNLIKLAYEMIKEIDNKNVRFSSAYFGWVKFELEPASIADIEKFAKTNNSVLRHIIIKTVRESTMYSAKLAKPASKKPADAETEGVAPINEAEVDKKIEELVEEKLEL